MEISLIISGNLTGFSRFYASQNANDVYNEAKFDFDYRNFLTFLSAGEKAYAISFSPKIIAVSLITRILDSFRRPGILVITTLVPRYQLVCGRLNPNEKDAIFRLLNEVNDKFYEKNFLNGMVNQNPAVLMQDYYSDILSRYIFVNDRMQRPINTRIDVTSPNKRIGYVAASESSMPQYLSSVMRKSYEGYHHVFLSPHAPQNIDEPAEEIITYKVRIENGNRPVPGEVRLTDRIPNINPEQGEKDIPNKNFTYGQVISGEAGTDIIGTIENGETIVLNYRFPQEEKTVYFKFYDGANEVPVHIIRPIIVESNGTSYPLSTNSWPFRGKEIYGHKNLKSGNSEYTIDNPSLDISRMRNDETINVYVHRGWNLEYNFGNINNPKTIILTNRFSHERKVFDNITSIFVEHGLSGSQSDWDVEIQSDYYETVRIPATQRRFNIYPKRVNPINTVRQTDGRRNIPSRQGEQHRTTTGGSDQGLRISKGDQHTAKDSEQIRREKNKRYMTYGIAVVVTCLLVFGGIGGYKALFGDKKTDTADKDDVELIVDDSHYQKKNFSLSFVGIDGDPISKSTIDKLTLTFDPEQIVELNSDGNGYCVKYNPDDNPTDKVKINVSYVKCDLLAKDYKNIFEVKDLPDIVIVNLSVKESDINLYDKIVDGVKSKDYDDIERKVRDITDNLNGSYGTILSQKLLPQKPQTSEPNREQKEEPVVKEPTSNNTIRDAFDKLTLDSKTLEGISTQNEQERTRKEALLKVLIDLKSARENPEIIPNISDQNLHPDQKKVIQGLKQVYNRILSNKDKKRKRILLGKLKSALKSCNSLHQIKGNIISKTDEYKN